MQRRPASYQQLSAGLAFDWPMVLIRSSGDPRNLVAPLRAAVRDEDPAIALESVMTLEDRVRESLAKPRLYAVLLGGFAAFALAVAGVGLFGVLSYTVAQRTREIGVRMALGARSIDVVRLVAGQGLAMVAAGLAIGLAAVACLVRAISSLLYGVAPLDVSSFVAVPLLILIVSAVACLVPARRAAHVDPLRALRWDR